MKLRLNCKNLKVTPLKAIKKQQVLTTIMLLHVFMHFAIDKVIMYHKVTKVFKQKIFRTSFTTSFALNIRGSYFSLLGTKFNEENVFRKL